MTKLDETFFECPKRADLELFVGKRTLIYRIAALVMAHELSDWVS